MAVSAVVAAGFRVPVNVGVGPEKGPLCEAMRCVAMRGAASQGGATRCGVVNNSPPENQGLSGEVWGPLLGPLCLAGLGGARRGAAEHRVVMRSADLGLTPCGCPGYQPSSRGAFFPFCFRSRS